MKTIFLSVFICLPASIILLSSSCNSKSPVDVSEPCTEIGCSSGVTIILRPIDSTFPYGLYDVHITLQDEPTHSCSFVVYDDPDDCPSERCLSSDNCEIWIYFGPHVESEKVSFLYSVTSTPIEVVVYRDDILVGIDVFKPFYFTVQPNGPDCPPICLKAEHIVDLN